MRLGSCMFAGGRRPPCTRGQGALRPPGPPGIGGAVTGAEGGRSVRWRAAEAGVRPDEDG